MLVLLLNKLNSIVKICTNSFEQYEYSKAKSEIEKFFWKDFCDNYLEIVKKRIYNAKGNEKTSAQYTLYNSLLTILKLFAPIMPSITEEIYQTHFKKTEKDKSIHISSWPESKEQATYSLFNSFVEILSKIRHEKTLAQKSMNSEIILTIDKKVIKTLGNMLKDLKSVTNAKEIKEGEFKVEFI